jgi:excisionase family DNA binding protein
MLGTDSNPAVGTRSPLCLTVKEVADELRCTQRYVFMLIERGELDSFKSGVKRLVRMEDLKAYIDDLVEQEKAVRAGLATVA